MVNNSMASDLSGKRVVVTGGTRGIGAAIVRQLLDAGAKVVGSARTPVNDFAKDATFVQGDVGTLAGAREIAARATEILGGVDILVNNAGAARARPNGTLTIEDEEWIDALNANYLSAVRLSAALLPGMIARKTGVIVNISTGAALIPVPTLAHYGAAKAALNAYSKSLAAEVAPHGVRVNVVVPGNVTSPGADKIRVDLATAFGVEASALTANIPLGRMGAPTDIAAMVDFLVSDRAAWITGASFVVDGGETPFVR